MVQIQPDLELALLLSVCASVVLLFALILRASRPPPDDPRAKRLAERLAAEAAQRQRDRPGEHPSRARGRCGAREELELVVRK